MMNGIEKLSRAVRDTKNVFFILPKNNLIEMIINGSNETVNSLPKDMKTILLEKKGLAIENQLVEKYLNGTIDSKHKIILDNCEIRVFQETINVQSEI